MLDAIEQVFERIEAFPLSGAPREQLGRDLRVATSRPYAIYYLVRDAEVTIVRVLHGARDVDALAEDGGLD
jgi:toxin ParE1/3/4